jgi:hypothetical protein
LQHDFVLQQGKCEIVQKCGNIDRASAAYKLGNISRSYVNGDTSI